MFGTILAVVISLGLFFSMSYAATADIEHRLYVSADGVTPFDATTWDEVNNSSTQGTDANDHNMVVRTQDTITYTLEQGVNELNAHNVTSVVTLSGGQAWTDLPAQCLTANVSPVSKISDDKKTLTCNTGEHPQGSKLSVALKAVVNSAQNGDSVSASVVTTADSANAPATVSTSPVRVTAIYAIDVVNELARDSSNNIQAVYGENGPNGEEGVLIPSNIIVRLSKYSELPTNSGGVGSQNFTYSVPTYGPGVTANWRIADWIDGGACRKVSDNIESVACTQANPGDDVSIVAGNVNYAAATTPTSNLYRMLVYLWVPKTDAEAAASMTLTYSSHIQFAPSVPVSQSGLQSNGTGAETSTTNNTAQGGVLAVPPNGYCSTVTFQGDHHQGCGGSKNGTQTTTAGKQVFPGDAESSDLALEDSIRAYASFKSGSSFKGKQVVHCYKVDHRYFEYIRPAQYKEAYTGTTSTNPASFTYSSNYGTGQTNYSQNLIDSFGYSSSLGDSHLPVPVIEYATANIGSTDAELQSAQCDNATASWSATQPANPGDITMIRVRYTVPSDFGNAVVTLQEASRFTYKIRDDINPSAGTQAPLYAHLAATTGGSDVVYDASQEGVYASDTTGAYIDSSNTTTYAFNNYNIDRLNFVEAQMDIFKNLTDTNQEIEAGGTINYELRPVITGSPTVVAGATFTIEDRLPTHSSIDSVATYVPGSAKVTGTNGAYTSIEPTVGPCQEDSSTQCLKWELSNVSPNEDIATITYSLKVSDLLVTATADNAFSNKASITSSSTTINTLSDSDTNTAGIQRPNDSVTLTRNATGAYHIYKTDDLQEYAVNSPDSSDNYPKFTLHYENASSIDLSSGAIIDVLPYNGDTNHDNRRTNTFNDSSDSASKFTDTSEKQSPGLAAIPDLPDGATIEYVVYNAADANTYPENIASDPCNAKNLPNGFDPLGDSSHYCYLLRWNGGNNNGQLIGGGTTGTGATPWSSTAPADLNDVVAIRINTQPLAAGVASEPISYNIKPTGNVSGNVYCNNFSSRVPEISLEVRSNTVCARVTGEKTAVSSDSLAKTGLSLLPWVLAAVGALIAGAVILRLRYKHSR